MSDTEGNGIRDENSAETASPRFTPPAVGQGMNAREALWAAKNFYHQSLAGNDQARLFGTIVAAITLITSVASFAAGMVNRTPEADDLRLRINIRNQTPYSLMIARLTNSNSRVMGTPAILSGQSIELPYAMGTNLNSAPDLILRLATLGGRRNIDIFPTIEDNGRFVRVTRVRFWDAGDFEQSFPHQEHTLTNINTYISRPLDGVRVILISNTVTNGIDGRLDMTFLTR